ncbi:MAG: MFS transporter [Candidatus Dojkabacteria bacterium]
MIANRIKKLKLINEFYFFRIVFQISSYFMYTFYLILLYRQSNDIKILVIDSIIFYVGMWVGFIFGSFALQRIGYVNTFRLSFFFTALAGLAIAISIPQIALLFPVLSLLRGFGRGMFWPVYHTYTVKEFNVAERSSIISIVTSTGLLLDIAFPFLVGTLISSTGDYTLVYIIGSTILLTAIFLRFGYNKMPATNITSGEITRILKNKIFIKFGVLTVFNEMLNIVYVLIMLVLPFIITRNEGNTGAILSIVNLVAALTAFSQRKKQVNKGIGIAGLGYLFGIIGALILIVLWSTLGIALSMIFFILAISLAGPLEEKLVIYIKQKILGDQKNQSTIELNMVIETLYLVGRMAGLVIFLLCFSFNDDIGNIFRIFILMCALWSCINVFYLAKIAKSHKKELADINLPASPQELPA